MILRQKELNDLQISGWAASWQRWFRLYCGGWLFETNMEK